MPPRFVVFRPAGVSKKSFVVLGQIVPAAGRPQGIEAVVFAQALPKSLVGKLLKRELPVKYKEVFDGGDYTGYSRIFRLRISV